MDKEETFDFSAGRPPIRIGIVGVGRAAMLTHLPAFQALPDLYRVTAVCDIIKGRRDRIEKLYPDYFCAECKAFYNEINGEYYLNIMLYRKDFEPDIYLNEGRGSFDT